ncbi:MAG: ACT domain-containing protein [Verrucomicrobiales bacterium]|nr:ACT domain-containing protein [Verrucomicrobiales bacterium]
MSAPNYTSVIATVVGPDRPGLVELISKAVSGHGGNWEESRFAHLAGQFAGMLRIEIPEANLADLEASLNALAESGLTVSVTRGGDDGESGSGNWTTLNLSLVGQDRPGIVSEVSHALAERGINVEELSTEVESAPMSGELLFRADAELSCPSDLALDELRSALEAIGPELMVELSASD